VSSVWELVRVVDRVLVTVSVGITASVVVLGDDASEVVLVALTGSKLRQVLPADGMVVRTPVPVQISH